MENLEHFLVLEDTEETVEEDLEADWRGLRSVQHETGDVEDD